MANWWDYWSPGLQATGGLIELLGLWHLVREWRFSMLENEVKSRLDESQGLLEFLKLLDDAFKNLSQKVGECGIEWSPSWLKEIGDRVASIEEKIEHPQKLYKSASGAVLHIRKRRYIIGVLLIVCGALTQIAANVLSSLGNYGLFT